MVLWMKLTFPIHCLEDRKTWISTTPEQCILMNCPYLLHDKHGLVYEGKWWGTCMWRSEGGIKNLLVLIFHLTVCIVSHYQTQSLRIWLVSLASFLMGSLFPSHAEIASCFLAYVLDLSGFCGSGVLGCMTSVLTAEPSL